MKETKRWEEKVGIIIDEMECKLDGLEEIMEGMNEESIRYEELQEIYDVIESARDDLECINWGD